MAELASPTSWLLLPLYWIAYATPPCFHWISAAEQDAPQVIGRKRPSMPRASDTLRLMSSFAPLRPKNAAMKHAVDSWQPRTAPSDRWYCPFDTCSIAPCPREPLTSTETRDGSRTAIPL